MVKIVVCFKIVPDYETLSENDWMMENIPDMTYVKKIYNCFDEAALENALCLKDELEAKGMEVSCVAVTMGSGPVLQLRDLYARGFEKVVCIEGENMALSPWQTACVLSDYVKNEKPDIIFTGRQCGGGDSGTVPAYMSHMLSVMWIPELVNIRTASVKPLLFEAECEDEIYEKRFLFHKPALVSVGNAKKSYLRMVSMKARMKNKNKEILHCTAQIMPVHEVNIRYYYKKTARRCMFLEGSTEEKSQKLLEMLKRGGAYR